MVYPDIAISDSGQYQVAAAGYYQTAPPFTNYLNPGSPLYSTDYGNTWSYMDPTDNRSYNGYWVGVSMRERCVRYQFSY